MKADYPLRFISNVINEFQKGKECGDESFIILPSLFEITKPIIFVEIPCCELNEIKIFFEEISQIYQQWFQDGNNVKN